MRFPQSLCSFAMTNSNTKYVAGNERMKREKIWGGGLIWIIMWNII